MGVNEDVLQFHQCRHTHSVGRVLLEHQEGCAVSDETAMGRNTVHDGAHTELAHTVIDVVAASISRFNTFRGFYQGQV